MHSRAQIVLLSILTLILASAAIGLSVYTFKNSKKSDPDSLVKNLSNNENPQELEEKTAVELSKNIKSDNFTLRTLASIIDVIKSKQHDTELSDEELKKYLRDKISKVDGFSYSFTREDIKVAKNRNNKQDIENYLMEVYNVIPKQTVFLGTVDIDILENSNQEELKKELERLVELDQRSFDDLLKINVPDDAVLIHETYLKLIELEIAFFEVNRQIESDPLKAKYIFSDIKTELPNLNNVLRQELNRISEKYAIELQIMN